MCCSVAAIHGVLCIACRFSSMRQDMCRIHHDRCHAVSWYGKSCREAIHRQRVIHHTGRQAPRLSGAQGSRPGRCLLGCSSVCRQHVAEQLQPGLHTSFGESGRGGYEAWHHDSSWCVCMCMCVCVCVCIGVCVCVCARASCYLSN